PRREGQTALHGRAVALREMMGELHIKHGSVNCALPAQSVFARFVKLPSLEHEKLEKVIAFDEQENVPLPIDDVVWDYQVVGAGLDEQVKVILVAIKHDLLDGINGAVEETGLLTSTIDVAPMALYNAFRYSYPNVNDCALLVDIGARTTNVLVIEPRRIFSRSLPIGGSSITGAIAKEFGESFEAAETRKKRDGFVSLGGAYADPSDQDIARVSKLARSTMTRLHAELMRSISHYRAQQGGSRPDCIFLCGGAAGIAYMRELFNEKFKLPNDIVNQIRKVDVSGAR